MNIQDRFALGMKRVIPRMLLDNGCQIELGPGKSPVASCDISFDYPFWDADVDSIPMPDECVQTIHAYHFLEHVFDPTKVLQECQRILSPGGHINIVVPYYKSALAYEDLDHKHVFCERTWERMFRNDGYDKHGFEWKMKVHFNIIIGIVERNMCLMTQLVKI